MKHSKLICRAWSSVVIVSYFFALAAPQAAYADSQASAQNQNTSSNKLSQTIEMVSGIGAIVIGGIIIKKAMAGGPDSAMEYAMGGMMILTGLGQLANAAQMGKDAAASKQAAANLTPSVTNLATPGTGASIDPSLLAKIPTGNSGVDTAKLASAMQSGVTPAQALEAASNGTIPAAAVQAAMDSASKLSPDDQKSLLAKSGLAEMQAKIADGIGSADGAGGMSASAKSGGSSGDAAYSPFPGADDGAKPTDVKLSKDVENALAAKAKQDQLNGLTNGTIFQQVHKKYAEKFGMLYGQMSNPGALIGIAGADGKSSAAPAAATAQEPARQPASLQ